MNRTTPSTTADARPVLAVVDLRKVYSDMVAVDGISFAVHRNEIVGLLGPNGAGKTTTINMILGVLEPDVGHASRSKACDIAAHRSRGARTAQISRPSTRRCPGT